jgi:hypothetical protein
VNGYEVKARRHARQIVQDLRWHGMTVPSVYADMAGEFQELVRSGEYAAWVAANQRTTSFAGRLPMRGIAGRPQPSRSRASRSVWHPSLATRAVRPLTDGLIRERVRSEG